MAVVSCLLLPLLLQGQFLLHYDSSKIVNARENGLAGLVGAPVVQDEVREVVEGTLEPGLEELEELGMLEEFEALHDSTVAADIAHAVEEAVERAGLSAE